MTQHEQSDGRRVAVGGGAEPVDFDDSLQSCYFNTPPPLNPHMLEGGGGVQCDLSNLFLTRHQDVSAWPLQN